MSARGDLAELTRDARLVVCVGPGGVGKTTVSAALAVRAARAGRRVFLLTIDPARRLADALSIALDDDASRVPLEASGTLDAAMLETSASWDAFVGRVADDEAARVRILENRVYRAFSRTLARSHAYVAMERLHHVLTERDAEGRARWDLVVLDTPPTRSALDVLDAPSSLVRFVDERVIGAFAGGGGSLRSSGGRAARRALGWIMGERLAGELATFLEVFAPMRAGFAARAHAVHAELAARSTSFVLVTAPSAVHLGDAQFLAIDLARRGLALDALVVNRAFHTDPLAPGEPLGTVEPVVSSAAREVLAGAPGGSAAEATQVLELARTTRRRARDEDASAEQASRTLAERAGARRGYVLPLLPSEPCTPDALLGLADSARTL